jgi:hypothetical protein
MITSRDLEWVAGFIEGEGNFSFAQKCIRIAVCQVQKWPLDKMQTILGGHVWFMQPRKRGKEQDIYKWSLAGSNAAGLCMTLYPLMSPKRQGQIKEVLAKWKALRMSNKMKRKLRELA